MARAILCLAPCMLGLGLSASAQELITAIRFEAPWAATGEWQGTQGFQINPAGAMVGVYSDSDNVYHGFLRAPDGKFIPIDHPYAGSAKDVTAVFQNMFLWEGQGTYPLGIDPAGAIAGFYIDGSDLAHGFLRTPDGNFTTLDAPSEYVGTSFGQGTYAANIGPTGVIAGNTVDSSNAAHTFLLARDGTFTMVNVSGAGGGSGQGTWTGWAEYVGPGGAIPGWYIDQYDVAHGYVRTDAGTIATFDAPGAGAAQGSFEGTYAWALNSAGAAIGEYIDTNYVGHGFVRAPDGTITPIDVWDAGKSAGQGTIPMTINSAGVIVGEYIDAGGVSHGFVRAPDGRISKFDVWGAGHESGQGTIPTVNNDAGAISGMYLDHGNVFHGFLLPPMP